MDLCRSAPERARAVLVSATHSGAGKTAVTRALLAALGSRGLTVQAFKIGPDFIDPMYHTALVGRPSVNLDGWMMGVDGVRDVFDRWTADVDVAVIEAMGALFDGADGGHDGSAAHLGAILDVPVLVVVDVWGMTRTTAALMDGLDRFQPAVKIAGYVLNRVGSDGHRQLIERAIGKERWSRVVATIEAAPAFEVPERHLGLLTTHENPGAVTADLADVARHIDLDRVLGQPTVPRRDRPDRRSADPPVRPRARLAIARDAAFCFYYEENLGALTRAGFELVEFSPVAGDGLPESTDAVYLGGGYPESFADQLAANQRLAHDLDRAANYGMPIYGECGGLIYLSRSLRTFDGQVHRMGGVLPIDVAMDDRHLSIRYVELTTQTASLLGPEGTVIRGQEFHQSRILRSSIEARLFSVETSDGHRFEAGYLHRSVVASYVHAYFGHCTCAVPAAFFTAATTWPRPTPA